MDLSLLLYLLVQSFRRGDCYYWKELLFPTLLNKDGEKASFSSLSLKEMKLFEGFSTRAQSSARLRPSEK